MGKGPFKLRSGNTTPFKQMGNSPVKHPHATIEEAESHPWDGPRYPKKKEEVWEGEEYPVEQDVASQEVSDVTPTDSDVLAAQEFQDTPTGQGVPTSIKEGEESVVAKEEIIKEKVTPEIGHTVVSRTGRSPGPGYEKIKGTNQWEYTGYGV